MSNGVEFNGPIDGRNVVAGPVTHAGATSNFNFYSSGAAERGSSPVPKPHSTVPFPPDPHFVDRPDIIEWMQQKDTEPAARMALVGLGGIGYEYPELQDEEYTLTGPENHSLPFITHMLSETALRTRGFFGCMAVQLSAFNKHITTLQTHSTYLAARTPTPTYSSSYISGCVVRTMGAGS